MKPRFIVAAIVLALLGLDGVARADEFLKPGDSMTLELPIENGDSGGAKATGVTLVPTFEEVSPAGFAQYLSIDQQGSVLGPFDIEVGADKAKTFKAKVVLAANASVDGTFKVKLRLTEASNNRVLMPDPETLDTSVLFNVQAAVASPPLVSIIAEYDFLFDRLYGTAVSTPTTRAPNASVSIHDDVGIVSVNLPGVVTVNYPAEATPTSFPPGTKDAQISISGLVPGEYPFSATNAAGLVTRGSWRVESLALVVDQTAATYNALIDALGATINISANSTAGIERIVQFDPTTQIQIADFGTGPFSLNVPPTSGLETYNLLSRDQQGNAAFQQLGVYETSFTFPDNAPGLVGGHLEVKGGGSVSAALSFPVNNTPVQTGLIKPGIFRVEGDALTNLGLFVGTYEIPGPIPIASNPTDATYSLTANGQVIASGGFSGGAPVVPGATILVPESVSFTLTLVPASGLSSAFCLESSGTTCLRPLAPMVSARPSVRALFYDMPLPSLGPHIPVYAGSGQTISLGNGAVLSNFSAISSGLMGKASLAYRFADAAYVNLIGGDQAYGINASTPPYYATPFTISLTFDTAKHTAGRETRIARLDPCKLTLFPTTIAGNKATASVDGFGEFVIVESKYETPYSADNGRCHFNSGVPGVTVEFSEESPPLGQAINVFGSMGLMPVGATCRLGPTGTAFAPAGVMTVCYDPADLTQAGGAVDAVTLYQFNGNGVRERLADPFIDARRGLVSGRVTSFSSEFGIFAPTTTVPARDLLAPITTLSLDGATAPAAAYLIMSTTSTVSLSAVDPVFSGAPRSGVADTFILIDAPFLSTGSTPGAPYAGPFNLGVGSHTLTFYSVDSAGNVEQARVVSVLANVPPARGVGGLGIGRDAMNRLWTVALDGGVMTLARTDDAGVVVASAPLPQAASDAQWGVFFDEAGGAYAVGTADGPSTIAADLAVYKASVDGGAIVSSRIFDSGFGNNDRAFDVAVPGWIAGAVQVSGPADFESPGERVHQLALWRFNTADGTVALSTTFARGAAMGVAVDADGSVWVAGYYGGASPRSSRILDLGLWHFAADGQTLLAGPFRSEAYIADFSSTFATKILISSGAVAVVAPRGRPGGGTDIGLVRFDKATGAVLSENAWKPADGSNAYPAALLADGGGALAAGGLDAGDTRAGLWRYGADGNLVSASSVDADGARGAAVRGAELWLAVDGATAPYKVTSESALPGELVDVLPPRVELAVGDPSFVSSGGAVFISSASSLSFVSADDKLAVGDGSGSGATIVYYRADSTGSFAAFTSSFSFEAEGAHSVEFYGVDAVENPGPILSRSISVDRTAPVSELVQNGAEIALAASDSNGAGVARIRYIVDYSNPDVCNNVAEDTSAARGTCENPWYAGPFTLSNGSHIVRVQAFDAVGNAEIAQTFYPFVQPAGDGGGVGGLGIGRDASDSFWTVNADVASVAFTRADASGTMISSAALQDGAGDLPWSVFFDAGGRAYAIGMADGPEAQAFDLAIYKASPSGDAIETRTLFDSGYANNELVLDAKVPGWIAGSVQTAGPADFNVEGDRSLAMALWRFDPVLGAVQLSTSASRAGFDFASGLAVDADASLWVAGYSARPDAPVVGGLDLALWHYASDGRTLLGGPYFKPGYLSDFNGAIGAKVHVTGDAVYVAAPRINGAGGFDMAFVKFDKATGQAVVEKIWREAGGDSSYPAAILPEAGGILIAGGIGLDMTDAALWRFGYDGVFQGAATADAGGARGAVFRGSELWLSVDGSTAPYRVSSEVPVAGTLIDISTPAAPALALTPSTGPIGVPFVIAGAGFGAYGGANTRVKFGTLAAPLSLWNDAQIKGTIPGLSTGTYAVTIERQNVSSVTAVSAGDFVVTGLSSATLNVSSGPIGAPFTFTGAGFGPYAGTLSRVLVDGATAPLSVWNDATISGTIPGAAAGAKTIVIQRQAGSFLSTSDGFAFEVTTPSVTAVSPSSGPIGAVFTLSGRSFGPYAGVNTRILIGGATAPLSLWNDTTIKGTVPGSLSPGIQAVIVERRTSGGGLVQSGTAYFQVAGLMVSSLAPSSGPIGVPFTISGAGFGAYAGADTRVRFGVSTAALSLWNDTTIKGTIPALAAGEWSVTVERQQGAGTASVSAGTFTATAPSVGGISPSSGPIGAPFTITGSQFGVYGGANTRVTFNGVAAPLSLWNDTTITGTVPALSTGTVDVVVERQQGADVSASPVSSFTVVELAPAAMTPETGPIGTAFTITGSGFGPYAGAGTRVLIGGAAAALSLWNDTTIKGTIPNLPAGSQPLWLERSAGAGVQSSATHYFEVTVPAVAEMTPSSAPIGAPFTITGTSFGAYAGAATRVTFNGVTAPLSLWNDTTITGTVPALPAGAVDVVVERAAGEGLASSGISSFTVLVPSVTGSSPGSGPIGTAFTITGSGFGPYAGVNTRILIGGATAPLSLWNDTTIKGTIPNLPSGAHPVWLERSAGSGVSSSATSYFDVTLPEVAALTPSSAPIGAPFTITGTSFGAYAGAATRVKFNGVAAPLSLWNDTQIKGTVPGSLAPGAAEVVVERAAGAGLTVSATQAFFVVAPVISTVSPSYGPAGTVVTVAGTGFGPYSGTLTRLLVGGSTVPLSVWNDTTIRWTVPAFLADGEYPVVVERSPAGGTVTSASATFTVGSPYSGGESLAFSSTLSLAATPDSYFEGDMSLSSATGGRIDTPAKAAVDIPPNAMEEDTAITLKRLPDDGRRDDAADEIHKRAAGEPIEFGPEGTRFATPVTIELPYDPALAGDESRIAIHYYNPLRREWEELPSVVDRARKVVTAKTDHFSIYQPMGLAPMTAAQDEFYYRDAYAFPNPSRGGAAVTFRIQPGLAETVEVRVYDLSGRKIHQSSDFTFLGAIDDGNGKGAQNTYDHAWGVSGVGSGVYSFVIKASRGGNKPITKSGKVGVIK